MAEQLYSIRMRAEQGGEHCSGAERIATAAALPGLAAELVARALANSSGAPDAVNCRIDRLSGTIPCRRLPDIRTYEVSDWLAGRSCARALLVKAGVADSVANATLDLLAAGPAPGGRVMRGAMIIEADTGRRLEDDPSRGVRVSRMDLAPLARTAIVATLAAAGLGHPRVTEALVLAGKVLQGPGVVAELCWSDDPDYLSGYVTDPRLGYQRITPLKATGDRHGGRAVFVRGKGWNSAAFCSYLEGQPVLFDQLGAIVPPQPWRG